uniref:Uncharacterized protein n=1 Tax=Arundo donax TaxID=35708 RepID=A0A0A9FJ90_ARUDO
MEHRLTFSQHPLNRKIPIKTIFTGSKKSAINSGPGHWRYSAGTLSITSFKRTWKQSVYFRYCRGIWKQSNFRVVYFDAENPKIMKPLIRNAELDGN